MKSRRHAKLPGYSDALEVEVVRAEDLTEQRFFRDYVDRCRPCRIRGAINHWPAMRLWKSPDYLCDKVGAEKPVQARTYPRIEPLPMHEQNLATAIEIPFGEFVRRATAPDCGYLVVHAYTVAMPSLREQRLLQKFPLAASPPESGLLSPLRGDIAGFSFLAHARGPGKYEPYRSFLFRNSYTDWHWHPEDEALMCQVQGPKEALLLAPDEAAWNCLSPILAEHGRTFDHDVADRFAGLQFHRTVVEPGDALYIPVYWWHSVESIEDAMGVTVAASFRNGARHAGNLRYPAARSFFAAQLRGSWPERVLNATAIATTVATSYATRAAARLRRPNG